MRVTKKELEQIIRESLMDSLRDAGETVMSAAESGLEAASDAAGSLMKSRGSCIVAVTDNDVIGPAIKQFLGVNVDLSWFPSGHAYGAVIKPDGSMKMYSFGPPICQNPKTLANKVMSKNPVPFLTSCTVSVKSSRASIGQTGLTESQAKSAARKIRNSFGIGKMRYAAFNYINAEESLAMVPDNRDCRAYAIIPLGLSASEYTDADNCATFCLDILQAGTDVVRGAMLSTAEFLTAPSLIVSALRPICNHYGEI